MDAQSVVTARIVTSELPCFVGRLSKKKQTLTTVLFANKYNWVILTLLIEENPIILERMGEKSFANYFFIFF